MGAFANSVIIVINSVSSAVLLCTVHLQSCMIFVKHQQRHQVACSNWQPAKVSELQHAAAGSGATALLPSSWQHVGGTASMAVRWQKLQGSLGDVGGPEGLFMHLFGQEGAKDTFWLDRYVVHAKPACCKDSWTSKERQGLHSRCQCNEQPSVILGCRIISHSSYSHQRCKK